MILLFLFFVAFAASTLGAIVGFGGGVIIKPVLDALGILPVSTISFLSGCTVFCMSVSSLIRSRGNGIVLDKRTITPLAVGAAAGGIAGQELFSLVLKSSGERAAGSAQAALLGVVTLLVFVYTVKKSALPSYRVKNPPACFAIGLVLGVISAFLGIGGGPINIAVLFFFFTMDAKTAAKNSIYVILFSQGAGLLKMLLSGSVPSFSPPDLILMAAGGVAGALLGAAISKKLDNAKLEKVLYGFYLVITAICVFNFLKFTL